MFDKYYNGAWQEPDDTVRKNSNGAWEECEFARRVISGAWEDVWTNAVRFLKNGVLLNGATLGANGVQGSGSVYGSTSSSNADLQLVQFQFTSDMVGKKIYVRASDNVTLRNPSGGYGYLTLTFPNGEFSGSTIWCTSSINGLLTFNITSDYVAVARNSYIGIGNTSSNTNYHIYDIYVDD